MQGSFSLVASLPLSPLFICSNEQFVFLGPEPSVEFWSSWMRSLALARLGAQFGYLELGIPQMSLLFPLG